MVSCVVECCPESALQENELVPVLKHGKVIFLRSTQRCLLHAADLAWRLPLHLLPANDTHDNGTVCWEEVWGVLQQSEDEVLLELLRELGVLSQNPAHWEPFRIEVGCQCGRGEVIVTLSPILLDGATLYFPRRADAESFARAATGNGSWAVARRVPSSLP